MGTAVEVRGASKPGTLVYNSWLRMQQLGETNPDVCAYNDLALIKLDPADVSTTNPNGWSHPVYTVMPGIPGDSGSAFMDKQGKALGVLSTLASLRWCSATVWVTSAASTRTCGPTSTLRSPWPWALRRSAAR